MKNHVTKQLPRHREPKRIRLREGCAAQSRARSASPRRYPIRRPTPAQRGGDHHPLVRRRFSRHQKRSRRRAIKIRDENSNRSRRNRVLRKPLRQKSRAPPHSGRAPLMPVRRRRTRLPRPRGRAGCKACKCLPRRTPRYRLMPSRRQPARRLTTSLAVMRQTKKSRLRPSMSRMLKLIA